MCRPYARARRGRTAVGASGVMAATLSARAIGLAPICLRVSGRTGHRRLSHLGTSCCVHRRVSLHRVTGIDAGAPAALAGAVRVPGRSGMVTLPCAVMPKLARLPARNGAEAGYHACGSPRVTVQPPPGRVLPGGGDSPDLPGGPGPDAADAGLHLGPPGLRRISHGRAGPGRRVEPLGRSPPARRGPVRRRGGLQQMRRPPRGRGGGQDRGRQAPPAPAANGGRPADQPAHERLRRAGGSCGASPGTAA